MTLPYGFRIVGACTGDRRIVDHAAAFSAYAACDERAAVNKEGYLSAFSFSEDFRTLLESTGSCRGFDGFCWAPWLWFDIDRADLNTALKDARRLALFLVERYLVGEDNLLLFYSGSKGFHVGTPTAIWGPAPSGVFNRVCRRLAERIAEVATIAIDTGVYDKVRPFRAPNSQHPKIGLHKRHLSFDELMGLSVDRIRQLAQTPTPFDLPTPQAICPQAVDDWQAATKAVEQGRQAKAERSAIGTPTLNRLTLEFIRDGAGEGDRHRLLYSAARNLAEYGCPPALAHALLTETALDSGLSPSDVRRQIDCGLKDQPPIADAEQPPTPSELTAPTAADVQAQLAALWQSSAPTPTAVMPAQSEGTGSALAEEGGGHGDAWEHPLDRLGVIDPAAITFPFGVDAAGPYGREGERR